MSNQTSSEQYTSQTSQLFIKYLTLFLLASLTFLPSCFLKRPEAQKPPCQYIIYDQNQQGTLRSACNKKLPDLQVWFAPKTDDPPLLLFGKTSISNTENMVLNATFGPNETIYLLANRVDRSAEELYAVHRETKKIKLLGSLEDWKVSNAVEASLKYNAQQDSLSFEAMAVEDPYQSGQLPSDNKFSIGPMNDIGKKPKLKAMK